MKLFLGSDHGGFPLKEHIKEHLIKNGYEVVDKGTYSTDSVDYPVFAEAVCREVLKEAGSAGILVCGTGIGMSMAANKVKGIRCALVGDCYSARLTRMHNDANVIALGARVVGPDLALDIVDSYLNSAYEGGRHQKRLDMIHALEAEA